MLYENAALYDVLLPASSSQVDHYTRLAQTHAGPVLALACGSGQLIVPIAVKGLPVTGLDISPQMLESARQRATAASARVNLVAGDMRKFEIDQQFSLIFVARNSLL